jgi:cytochrome c biogenesis protein CcmG/thiol:disulfide interchange protein DsbE
MQRYRTKLGTLLMIAVVGINACKHAARDEFQHADQRMAAPTFALTDSAGKSATLESYRGKVVLVDFWATWCHGCKEEIPWFTEFQRKYEPKGLEVVGVSMDEDWKTVKQFLASADVPYRIVLGNEGLSTQYGNYGMPDTFLLDRQGKIAATYRGMVNKDAVEKDLQTVLAQ